VDADLAALPDDIDALRAALTIDVNSLAILTP
jgi:hypothetical protein